MRCVIDPFIDHNYDYPKFFPSEFQGYCYDHGGRAKFLEDKSREFSLCIYHGNLENAKEVYKLVMQRMERYEDMYLTVDEKKRLAIDSLLKYDNNMTHETPLHFASREGHELCVEYLVSIGAYVNYNAAYCDVSPILFAVYGGHARCVQKLLESKASITGNKYCLLSIAAYEGHDSVLKTLLAHNSSMIDDNSYQGFSPLQLAAYNGHHSAITILLQWGAKRDSTINGEISFFYDRDKKPGYEEEKQFIKTWMPASRSLKCLSALSVLKNHISYNDIPSELISYVDDMSGKI